MKWIKKICILTSFLFSLSLHANNPLVVGTTSGYAPYVSLNEKGEYEGFDIDVAHLLAKKLNKKLVLQDLGSMPSLLMALQKKKIDTVIWAVSITQERQKEMSMIYYQGEQTKEAPFIFWKEIPENIRSIADLEKNGRRPICVESGSYQDTILQNYPKLNVRHIDKVLDAVMELRYGKCAATLVDYSLLPRLQAQYPEIKTLYLPLPPEEQSLGYGICVSKSNPDLAANIQKAIDELREEGKLAELEKKWNLSK